MKKSKKFFSIRNVIIMLSTIILISFTLVSFSNDKNSLNWKNIYSIFNLSPNSASEDDSFVKFIDVGQGDCALIYSNGKSMLIDTGTISGSGSLSQKLKSYGITNIDVVLITHFHADHAGGLTTIVDDFNVKSLILPDLNSDEECAKYVANAADTIKEAGGGIYPAQQGLNLNVGEFEITVLGYYDDLLDENNRSIVSMVEIDDVEFLMTGDAEKQVENRLIDENIDFDCDVLKAGHHGSKTSSSEKFLDIATPDYAIISCGIGNMYSHPNAETLDLLDEKNAKVYRTDLNGDITFNVEDGEIDIETDN